MKPKKDIGTKMRTACNNAALAVRDFGKTCEEAVNKLAKLREENEKSKNNETKRKINCKKRIH